MTVEGLKAAAAEFDTPLYLFDLDVLRQGVAEIKEALKGEISLCFAMKANPFLTEEMAGLVERIEVCSPGELQICKAKKIPMRQVIFSGVLKEESDITELLLGEELPVFTAESAVQVRMLSEKAEARKRKIEVLLRLTSGNQFGMNREELVRMAEETAGNPYVTIKGIHFYSGTQKRKTEQMKKELELLDEVCIQVKDKTGISMEHLEYGPGLGIEYFKGAKAWSYQEATDMLAEIRTFAKELKFGGSVTFELGRFLAAMCGSYLTRVREVKENHGVCYCLVDGGLHHMNYDGQVMAMKTPYCTQIPAREEETEETYHICGALCTVNDVLIKQYPLRGLQPGDLLVFERTGAYSMTEGMSLFLSRNLPAVVSYCKKEGFARLRAQTPSYPLNMCE